MPLPLALSSRRQRLQAACGASRRVRGGVLASACAQTLYARGLRQPPLARDCGFCGFSFSEQRCDAMGRVAQRSADFEWASKKKGLLTANNV